MTAILAHRGRLPGYTDNTIEAFLECARLGADGVELDVRRTGDGALVVFHDPVIPELGVIADHPVVSLPGWVPSLEEALEACTSMTVNVEIKNDPSEPGFDGSGSLAMAVAHAVGGHEEQVVVSCFHLPTLDLVHGSHPRVATTLLSTVTNETEIRRLATGGHTGVNMLDLSLSSDLVATAHRTGLKVAAWTVDASDRMSELARWGVDTIITNQLELALHTLRS